MGDILVLFWLWSHAFMVGYSDNQNIAFISVMSHWNSVGTASGVLTDV